MNSPKPKRRPWQSETKWIAPKQVRKHLNKKFYNSAQWRSTRESYLTYLQNKVWDEAKMHVWTLPQAELELNDMQSLYLLSIGFIPCETCVKLFAIGHYNTVNEGIELDHIEPLNPENALESRDWGDPFNRDNLQLLCRKHHARKSNRDKKIIELKLN